MSEEKAIINGEEFVVTSKESTIQESVKEEETPGFKLNRKQRIKLFQLKRALGYLPTKPESRIVGSHEYIRLENAIDPYYTKIEHKLIPQPESEHGKCEICSTSISTEDVTNKVVGPCRLEENPSQLDLKLTELKGAGRKLLDIQKEWGGWTIKVMALKTQSSVDVNPANEGNP